MRGTVTWYSRKKGYGFITDGDGRDHFVHYSSIINMDGFKSLSGGDIVDFELGVVDGGREQAVNVTPILTIQMVEKALEEENLILKSFRNSLGYDRYMVTDVNNVIQTTDQGMTLIETAAYAGIDVEGLVYGGI